MVVMMRDLVGLKYNLDVSILEIAASVSVRLTGRTGEDCLTELS